MVPLESQGLKTSQEAASHQPHRALRALHRSAPGTRFLSGLTTLPMFCRLCAFMTLSKRYGSDAVAQSQGPPLFPAHLTASEAVATLRADAAGRALVAG